MNNIRDKIQLSMIRGIPYGGWIGSQYRDQPACINLKPSMFTTRLDTVGASVNLSNYPLTL